MRRTSNFLPVYYNKPCLLGEGPIKPGTSYWTLYTATLHLHFDDVHEIRDKLTLTSYFLYSHSLKVK